MALASLAGSNAHHAKGSTEDDLVGSTIRSCSSHCNYSHDIPWFVGAGFVRDLGGSSLGQSGGINSRRSCRVWSGS